MHLFTFILVIWLKRQFGFRNNYSPNHSPINLVDLIEKYLDTGKYVCGEGDWSVKYFIL